MSGIRPLLPESGLAANHHEWSFNKAVYINLAVALGQINLMRAARFRLDLPKLQGCTTAAAKEATMQQFKVTGMTCGHCVRAVADAVRSVDPGAAVAVDLDAGRLTVENGQAPASRIAEAVAAEGYTAEPIAA